MEMDLNTIEWAFKIFNKSAKRDLFQNWTKTNITRGALVKAGFSSEKLSTIWYSYGYELSIAYRLLLQEIVNGVFNMFTCEVILGRHAFLTFCLLVALAALPEKSFAIDYTDTDGVSLAPGVATVITPGGTGDCGTCKRVTNNAVGKNLFVPTRTDTEWTTFYTNVGAGVATIADCGCVTTPTLASGTSYTLPAGCTSLTIKAWGGGGGGGGNGSKGSA